MWLFRKPQNFTTAKFKFSQYTLQFSYRIPNSLPLVETNEINSQIKPKLLRCSETKPLSVLNVFLLQHKLKQNIIPLKLTSMDDGFLGISESLRFRIEKTA